MQDRPQKFRKDGEGDRSIVLDVGKVFQSTFIPSTPPIQIPSKQPKTSPISSFDMNQIQVFQESDSFSEVILKGNLRCGRCIKVNRKECSISICLTKSLKKYAICRCCREIRKTIHDCRPNLDVLEKFFPNSSQIEATWTALKEYDLLMKKVKSSPKDQIKLNNLTKSNSQRQVGTGKQLSPVNQAKSSRQQEVPHRIRSGTRTRYRSTARFSPVILTAEKPKEKEIMVARKPQVSNVRPRTHSNSDSSASSSSSSGSCSSLSSTNFNTLDQSLSLIPSSSTIVAQTVNNGSSSSLPSMQHLLNSGQTLTADASSSMQTQASPATSMASTSASTKSGNESMNESICKRLEDLQQMLENQSRILVRGIKRDLESQK